MSFTKAQVRTGAFALLLAAVASFMVGCEEHDLRAGRSSRRDTYAKPLKPGTLTLAKDTRIRVRLGEMLHSDKTHEGHRFSATVVNDVRATGGRVALPRGTVIHGYVSDVRRLINRTSMQLRFDMADLADGRRVPMDATPVPESKIDMDDLAKKGAKEAGTFIVQKGIDAATGGVFFPVWVYLKAKKAYGFVTKESRVVLPKGCIITIELEQPAYVPPPETAVISDQ
jgi:hypothetical protein